jgi:poly(hydroxyalkanoate) granule-associated protein
MVTRKLKKKVQRKLAPVARKAENPVVDSARDIWLAGLGAFSVAQKEGERFIAESNKLFERLVQEGAKLESRTRKDMENAFEDVRGEFENRVRNFRGDVESRVKDFRGEVESRVDELRGEIESRFGVVRKQRENFEKQAESVRKQANEGWDKLETFFEDRVKRVLGRVGIPSRDDLDRLNKRVQELSRTLADLEQAGAPKKAAPKKAAPKKKAVRKSAARKAAPKAGTRPETTAAELAKAA